MIRRVPAMRSPDNTFQRNLRKQFRCPECGVSLYVSVTYSRTLFIVSAIAGFTLVELAVGN
jgi:transcription elongation factor Elf1